MQSESIWPPVLENLSKKLSQDEELVIAISPFIKRDALVALLDRFPAKGSRVIVRWKLEDFLAGVSDLEIYDILQERMIPLYQHSNIHLKLFQFSSGLAYSGSSNITSRGLSLGASFNEEMGMISQLDLDSYSHIRRLCDESRLVTPEMVKAYERAIEQSVVQKMELGELKLPPTEQKEFLVSELPATTNLGEFLNAAKMYLDRGEAKPSFLHDFTTLKITVEDLKSDDFRNKVISAFKSNEFVDRIIKEIRSHTDMNFGGVTAYVHDIAQDVPLPYRSEIKEAISRLYCWLQDCYEDISVFMPGAKSEVIMSSLANQRAGSARRLYRRRRR